MTATDRNPERITVLQRTVQLRGETGRAKPPITMAEVLTWRDEGRR